MAKSVHNDVLDAALDVVSAATRMTLCSSAPANFAGISSVALADATLDSGDFSIADGDTSGRKVTVAAQSGIEVDATGTVTHLALDDGETLLLVTEVTSQALTQGNTADVPAFDYEIADPS